MSRYLAILLCGGASAFCQTQVNYMFNLDTGALVLYQVYSEVPIADGDKSLSSAEFAGNRIRRLLKTPDGIPWLGFEVKVDPISGQDRFKLSVEPIAGVPFFERKPEARTIENADRILLDVLEQPSTGKRVFDTFQIGTKGTPMQIMPISRSVPQLLPAGSEIRLEKPRLVEGIETLAVGEATHSAKRVGVQAQKAGQFVFSSEPGPGFRLEGIAEGNSLRFVAGDKQYSLSCSAPVVGRSGSWYVWVKAGGAAISPHDSLQVFVP